MALFEDLFFVVLEHWIYWLLLGRDFYKDNKKHLALVHVRFNTDLYFLLAEKAETLQV